MPSVAGEIDSSELMVMLQWLGFSSCVSRAPQLLKQDLGREQARGQDSSRISYSYRPFGRTAMLD